VRLRRDAKIELLRGVPLFAGCSAKELGQISSLADELHQPEGTTLIKEGSKGREFFVLVDGAIEVRRAGRRVNALGPGSFFGEIALVSDTPRTATVAATAPVRLLVITGQSFRRLLDEQPSIRAKVLAALAERVAPTTP
jgi:CRP-like cAMP-binding protein